MKWKSPHILIRASFSALRNIVVIKKKSVRASESVNATR